MNYFVLLLALVGAALAKGGYSSDASPTLFTREGCPPPGYTALTGSMRLDNLPPGGLYAICLTPTEQTLIIDASPQRLVVNFTWNGVFKLTNSKLVVDTQIRLEARWPSRVEWNGVTAAMLPEPTFADGHWAGIVLHGAPDEMPSAGYGSKKQPETGNCGTLNKFTMTGVSEFNSSLTLMNCTGSTKLNRISVHHINAIPPSSTEPGVRLYTSSHLIFFDLVVSSRSDSVRAVATEAAFIRPALFSFSSDGFDLSDVSNITACDPLVRAIGDPAGDPMRSAWPFEVANSDDEGPSTVAVGGRTNSHFPEDLSLGFGGGLLFTLQKCPPKLNPTDIPIKNWDHWWTGNGASLD